MGDLNLDGKINKEDIYVPESQEFKDEGVNGLDIEILLVKSFESIKIPFDVGLGDLRLSLSDSVQLSVVPKFSSLLRIGIDNEGFQFKKPKHSGDFVRLDAELTVPNIEVNGQLGPIELLAKDLRFGAGGPLGVSMRVSYPGVVAPDSELELNGLLTDESVRFELPQASSFSLSLELGFKSNNKFPKISTDLKVEWGAGSLSTMGATINFENTELDVGSFIENILAPVFSEINKVVKPIKPILEMLTAPLPVISDLAGQSFSLLDLASMVSELGIGRGLRRKRSSRPLSLFVPSNQSLILFQHLLVGLFRWMDSQ